MPSTSDFQAAKFRGLVRKIVAAFTGRSNQLLNLETLTSGKNIRCRFHAGVNTVDIDKIKGSEGRGQDFDHKFHPLKSHNKARWLNIARAWRRGGLPAVELIKVKDIYIVRDGHHRVSVARFYGCKALDAQVTEWFLDD